MLTIFRLELADNGRCRAAATQFRDWGLPLAEGLADRGAGLALRASLPGAYDQPEELLECTATGLRPAHFRLRKPNPGVSAGGRGAGLILRYKVSEIIAHLQEGNGTLRPVNAFWIAHAPTAPCWLAEVSVDSRKAFTPG